MAITLGTADLSLTIAEQTALAPGGSEQWVVTKATANNQDASPQTVTLYRVPPGGAIDPTNIIVDAFPILAGETLALPLSAQAVLGGQTLQGKASVDNLVNLNITYEVVS